MLPTVIIFVGLDRDYIITSPGLTEWDFSDFSVTTFSCPGLSISKTTASAAQAVVQASGLELLVKFLAADTVNKTPTEYKYLVTCLRAADSKNFSPSETEGRLVLKAQPS